VATSSDRLKRPRPLEGARLDNHLLEAECLAHDLPTLRLSPVAFLVRHPDVERYAWGFTRSMSSESALVSRRICEDEAQLRALLGRNGVPTAAPGDGPVVRALVVGGEAVSMVDEAAPGRELVEQAHRSVRELAGDAARSLPGVPHASVDLKLADIATAVADQSAAVVAMDLNPSLADHRPPALPDGVPVEQHIVAHQVRQGRTERHDLTELHLEVALLGCSDPERAARLLGGTARRLGLEVSTSAHGDSAVAEVSGPTSEAAQLPAVVARRARRVHDVVRTRVLGGDR
jgi:hypothetical protein